LIFSQVTHSIIVFFEPVQLWEMSGDKKPGGSPAKIPSAKRKPSEDGGVDANIASSVSVAIELALAKQQDRLEAAMTRAVQGAARVRPYEKRMRNV